MTLVAALVVALVASALAVVALTGEAKDPYVPFDVAGKSVDTEVDPIDPMSRPQGAKGVEVEDPAAPDVDPDVPLPTTPKKVCKAVDHDALPDVDPNALPDVSQALAESEKICWASPTGQSEDLLDAPPLTLADGYEPAPVPTPAPEDEPSDEPTDGASDEPSDQPSGVPGEGASPSGSSSAEPSDEPSDEPSGDPSGAGADQAATPSVGRAPGGSLRVQPAMAVAAKAPSPTGEYLSPNWIKANPLAHPAHLNDHAMVYDGNLGKIILFGGRDANDVYQNKTWAWNGTTWQQLSPATSPSPRIRMTMAWDPVSQKVLMFGGQTTASLPSNEVWAWNGTTWALQTPTGTAPTARTGPAMAYDPTRQGMVVFGGRTTTGDLNDTWLLKNNAWTLIQAAGASGAPAARYDLQLAYSQSTSQLVMFGGVTGGCIAGCTIRNDTWVLNQSQSTWTQKSTAHTPAKRTRAAITFDPTLGGVSGGSGAVVMYGGFDFDGTNSSVLGDTWAWTGDDWVQAVGITQPSSRYSGAMAATPTGQVVFFGGIGPNGTQVYDETWTYDTAVPVLKIDVERPESNDDTTSGIFWTGDQIKIRITAANTSATAAIGGSSGPLSLVSALPSTLLAAGTLFDGGDPGAPGGLDDLASCVTSPTAFCGLVQDLTAAINNVEILAGGTVAGEFLATVAGSQKGCELIDIPAVASTLTGQSAEVSKRITVCGGGLGLEDWWTYDTTDLGGGGSASVNVANGNLVVKQYDTDPVQTPGRLAIGLGRVYNSQDNLSAAGPLGAGWQFDIGDTGETAGGFGLFGLRLLNLQSVTQPLSMPYIDRDGTRHTFKLRSITPTLGNLSLPIDLSSGAGSAILGLLNPGSLPFEVAPEGEDATYARLCIDQAYTGPPGSNMYLFRYIGMGGGCASAPDDGPLSIGWSLIRPDRVRYDFNVAGDLLRVTDPAGQQLIYTPGVQYGPTAIHSSSCRSGPACPSVTINYDKPSSSSNRLVEVKDSAGRITTYVVSRDVTRPQLLEVWEPGNPWSTTTGAKPTASYTYRLEGKSCADPRDDDPGASPGVLCSVTDALGATTVFEYGRAPVGPDRIKRVTDRRASANPDGSEGLATAYTWSDPEPDVPGGVYAVKADMATPNTLASCGTSCHRIRYAKIDAWGRVGQIDQGTSGGAQDAGIYTAQTGYFWDGMGAGGGIASCGEPTLAMNHNLCQVIKRAKASNADFTPGGVGTATVDGVPVQDQAVDYLYGDFGQRLRQRVLLDASQPWTDANSAITTWGSHQQYFDANGNRRFFNTHVRGNGAVRSTAAGGTYKQAVLASDPVAYWRLDEDDAAHDMVNVAGSGNVGDYAADARMGRPGAVHDDAAVGSSPTTWTSTIPSLTGFASGTSAGDSDFTIETWTKPVGTGDEYAMFWGSSYNAYGVVGRAWGGYPYVQLISDAAAGKQIYVYANAPLSVGEWHHVVYRYDGSGSAGGVSIWVDGVSVATTTTADTLNGQVAPATTAAGLGLSVGDSDLDEVALYASALQDGAIEAHYAAARGATRVKPDTLYAVADEVQELSPRGNAAEKWGDYLTTTRRDVPADGTPASTNKAAGESICGDAPRGNTGVVCEVDAPAAAGVSRGDACKASAANPPVGSPEIPTSASYASSCTKYEYNAFGQRTLMRTPKANSENKPGAFEYSYYPIVDECTGDKRASCDLSGHVSAGGWLKAVVDPEGKKLVYAYDAAGNVARTWDRNAAEGKALSASWADAATPPSTRFTDVVASNPVTSDALSVSNTALVAINPDGTVSGAGSNALGELGNGNTSAQPTPVRADPMTNVVQVAQSATGAFSGCAFTLYLTGSGEVWSAGSGATSTPTKVDGLANIISVAAGGCHALALDAEGNLWAWGANNNGQLGNGSTATAPAPVKVLEKVSTMAAGYLHSLAVTTDGKVWSWGYNADGQLGVGDTSNRTSPTEVSALSGAGIRQLSGGVLASYAVGRDGRVWAFGNNSQNDLGDGTATTRTSPVRLTTLGPGTTAGPVRQVVGAAYGAVALMADGTVRVWGLNNAGQSGGAASTATIPTPVKVPDLTGQVAVAGGWGTIATADQAGRIKVWGSTSNNQLANGTSPSTTGTPTVAGIDISPYKTALWGAQGTRDATGNLTTITRDKLGQPRRTRTGRGHDINTTAFDRMVGYDAAGRVTWSSGAQHRSASTVTRTTYDAFGNPVKVVDARGIAFRASFDALNRQLTNESTRDTTTACAGSATSADWTTAQAGHRICTTSTIYDGLGQPVKVTDANSQVTKTYFDAAGRNIRVDTPRNHGRFTGANAWVVSRSVFDKDGNVTVACSPRQADTTLKPGTSEQWEPQADGACNASSKYATSKAYDRAGNVTTSTRYRIGDNPSTLTTAFEYDADRNQVAVTDANQHRSTTEYDLLGRRTSQTAPRSGTKTFTTRWNYDPSGNVTAIRAPGSINTGSGADGHLVVSGTTAARSTDGIVHDSSNPFQVPDGAQYRNVTLENGAVVTSAVANGLMFHATGTVTICSTCTIKMDGKGETGGVADNGSGVGGDASNPNPGNGGKGGVGGLLGLDPSGGGGGGHKTDGGAAGPAGSGPGLPGKASGTSDFATVGTDYLQGSGGGGGGGGKNLLGTAGAGGNGGGFVRITATKIVVNGSIDASGADGGAGAGGSGGGGGGAGGGIWLAAPDVDLASANVLDVTGGTGGAGPTDRQGGNGSVGYVRIDADTVSNVPAGADRTRAAMVTAVSYDAANRPIDTIEGAQTVQADPTADASSFAVPNANGLSNTRTRNMYDADGHVIASLPPQAFSNAASLTAPNLNTARRVDYDLDGLPVAAYSPRFDNASGSTTSSIGSGSDGGGSANQQTDQCTTDRVPDQAAGPGNGASPASYTVLPSSYASTVGVCVTRTSYDPIGKVKRAWLPVSNGADNSYLDFAYTDDALSATVTGPSPTGTGRVAIRTTAYDGVGRSVKVLDAEQHGTTTEYTADGLVAKTIGQKYDPDDIDTDGDGDIDVTGPLPEIIENTAMDYDAGGHLITTTDPESRVTTQEWTSDDLLEKIEAPGPVTGQNAITKYGYDAVGNTVETWLPNAEASNERPVRNEFTDDNLLLATHTPITDNSYRTVRYAYSPAGLKVSTESARCNEGEANGWAQCMPTNTTNYHSAGFVRLTYGANGRPASQVGRDRDPTEGPTTSITTTYSQQGTPAKVIDPTSGITVEAGYYLDGLTRRVTESGSGLSGASNTNTYAYNAAGVVSVRTDDAGSSGLTSNGPSGPSGTVSTSYRYNQAGVPEAMTSSGVLGSGTSFGWDAAGRLRTVQTGSHLTERSWHPNNLLAGAKTTSNGTTVGEYRYLYDKSRHVIQQKVTGSAGGYTNDYTYTPAQQVKKWTYTATSGGGTNRTVDYEWDRNSNRTKVTEAPSGGASATTTTSYSQDNAITQTVLSGAVSGTSTYTYDAAGRMTKDGCNTYTYDAFDRIEKQILKGSDNGGAATCGDTSRTTSYSYDGMDRQRSMIASGATDTNANGTARSIYDGTSTTVVGQLDAVNGALSKPDLLYQLDPGGVAMAYKQTGAGAGTSFLDTDGQSNVTTVVSTAQSVDCGVRFDPFGNAVDAQPGADSNKTCHTGGAATTTGNSYWYRTQVRDASTGNYQLGARTYDPTKAAFTTPDAYRVSSPSTDLGVGTDPLTANTYTYVNGNPLNFGDPDGHRPICRGGEECNFTVDKKGHFTNITPKGPEPWVPPEGYIAEGAPLADFQAKDVFADWIYGARAEGASPEDAVKSAYEKWFTAFPDGRGRVEGYEDVANAYCQVFGQRCQVNPLEVGKQMAIDTWHEITGCFGELKLSACGALAVDAALYAIPFGLGKMAHAAKIADDIADVERTTKKLDDAAPGPKTNAANGERKVDDVDNLPCNCFVAGTKVQTAEGEKPIESIKIGDRVWAKNLKTDKNELRRVTGLFQKRADQIMTITVTGGVKVTVTEEHPFYVPSVGWVMSGDLQVGDQLAQRHGGNTTITSIDSGRGDTTVYNFEVAGDHNYYVTEAQLLVHNCRVPGKVPQLEGGTLQEVGGPIWRHGDPSSLIGKRTPDELRALASRSDAVKLRDFYQQAAEAGRGGATAPVRVRLAQEIIDAWD